MDTFRKLKKLWQPKHFKHLQYCLKHCQAYFEDHFEYVESEGETLLIDGVVYTQGDIIKILSDYYVDDNSEYYSSFGDAVYLFFTDLVECEVDILSQLDEESLEILTKEGKDEK